jgi:hypothetical protein
VSCASRRRRPRCWSARSLVHSPAGGPALVGRRHGIAKVVPPRGRGSVGRASPCQGEGRGFESRRPLQKSQVRGHFVGPDSCSEWAQSAGEGTIGGRGHKTQRYSAGRGDGTPRSASCGCGHGGGSHRPKVRVASGLCRSCARSAASFRPPTTSRRGSSARCVRHRGPPRHAISIDPSCFRRAAALERPSHFHQRCSRRGVRLPAV